MVRIKAAPPGKSSCIPGVQQQRPDESRKQAVFRDQLRRNCLVNEMAGRKRRNRGERKDRREKRFSAIFAFSAVNGGF
jgi:hypothetical protein